jgi:hypothetical protein
MRTYKQGLLAFSFAVAVSTGCTYDENDLHAGHRDAALTPAGEDALPATGDLSGTPGEQDGGVSATDAEVADAGFGLDTQPTPDAPAVSPDVPSPGIEVGADTKEVGADAKIDSAADGRQDAVTTSPDGAADRGSDVSSPDAGNPDGGESAVDSQVTEAGFVDGNA